MDRLLDALVRLLQPLFRQIDDALADLDERTDR